ncbi:probable E3 ubiquitin-protein ligase TRIML1 [Sarcophilus harrisii]|uniref:probable E3 ubiquitin-protein ligase TRIML1 n=1 Tax=Sarcophilus harrisii TaxID=9305 RepID=UPI000273B002|nr:probable E3 ubiquitin-protein ligase TRIML1 [Sarcophilus harrisii]
MEAAGKLVKEMQNDITCTICRGYFPEPVTMACGHIFCQACISSIGTVGATTFSCPECRQESQEREIPVVNRSLAELTELDEEFCSGLLQSTQGQSQCVLHKKLLKLFCEDDQTLLCTACCETPEHGAHKILPVKEAAQNCRQKLQLIVSRLEEHCKQYNKLLALEENSAADWPLMVKEEYCKAQFFHLEEELHSLERLTQEEKANEDRIKQHMQNLLNLMEELEEAGQQPHLDVLYSAKELLRRSEIVLSQRAKAVIPELKECIIPGMMELLKKFKVELTLDRTSADSWVIVSEDLKSLKAEGDWEGEMEPPEDLPFHCVFAEQIFSSGRQYWEVDVSQVPQWSLGIYTPNLKIKNDRDMDSCSSVFLLRRIKKEEDYYLQTYPGLLNHRVKDPMSRIGVYLEYFPGTLVFYNVQQSSLIYRFYPIFFLETVTPFFSPGPPLPGTQPGPMTLCSVDSYICNCCYTGLSIYSGRNSQGTTRFQS